MKILEPGKILPGNQPINCWKLCNIYILISIQLIHTYVLKVQRLSKSYIKELSRVNIK
jgi:hypothetical protein